MCTHFHLLDLLTERSTVTGTVLSGDADLLSAYIAINIVVLIVEQEGQPYAWSFWRCCVGLTGGLKVQACASQFRSIVWAGLAGSLATLCRFGCAFLADQPTPT